MQGPRISEEQRFRVEFYDVDSMHIAWHGNYVKYMELGRCALLDKIGFGYKQMAESGYLWPVVDMRIKFIRPLTFGMNATIRAELAEYENRIKILFEIFDDATGTLTTKAESVQMAVEASSGESLFVSPPCLTLKVEGIMKEVRP